MREKRKSELLKRIAILFTIALYLKEMSEDIIKELQTVKRMVEEEDGRNNEE